MSEMLCDDEQLAKKRRVADGGSAVDVVLSATFERADGERPLARCINWAHWNQVQGSKMQFLPMVVLAEERDCGGRRYLALSRRALETYYGKFFDAANRHLNEVVPRNTPCRLYCDFEHRLDGTPAEREALVEELEQSSLQLVRAVVAHVREKFGVKLVPFVTEAHKQSKWSKHVVFSGAIFADANHCGALMRELVVGEAAYEKFVDLGVYSGNHCIRMLDATKLGEPQRPLRVCARTHPKLARAAPRKLLWRSLITGFALDAFTARRSAVDVVVSAESSESVSVASGGGEDGWTTGLFVARFHKEWLTDAGEPLRLIEHPDALKASRRQLSHSTSISEESLVIGDSDVDVVRVQNDDDAAGAGVDKLTFADVLPREQLVRLDRRRVHAAAAKLFGETFACWRPQYLRSVGNSTLFTLSCKSRHCSVAQREHHSNHVYVLIDATHARWRQQCHNEQCKDALESAWESFDSCSREENACAALFATSPQMKPFATTPLALDIDALCKQ